MIQKISFLFVIILSIFFSSCEKQEEEINNRDKVVGTWNVVENEVTVNPASVELRKVEEAYIVHLTRSEIFADEVYIYNFFNIGSDFHVPAYIENKTITISKVTLEDHTIHGNGTISNDNQTIDWTYWVEDPFGDEKEYRATYSFRN